MRVKRRHFKFLRSKPHPSMCEYVGSEGHIGAYRRHDGEELPVTKRVRVVLNERQAREPLAGLLFTGSSFGSRSLTRCVLI